MDCTQFNLFEKKAEGWLCYTGQVPPWKETTGTKRALQEEKNISIRNGSKIIQATKHKISVSVMAD